MRTRISILLLLAFLAVSCGTEKKPTPADLPSQKGPIHITGAFALYPMVKIWISEYQKIHPETRFELTGIGSWQGLTAIKNGKTDLAMISSEIPKGIDTLLWIIPVARLGVVAVTGSKNPYLPMILGKGMKKDDLAATFSGEKVPCWGDLYGSRGKDRMIPYMRSDSSGATDVLAHFLWLDPAQIKGKPCYGEPAMVDAIRKDPLGIGYLNFIYAIDPLKGTFADGITVIPIDFDLNGKIDSREKIFFEESDLQRAMWLGKFPCSLVRNLYLVTNGKPATKEVVDFLAWVVNDGQQFVAKEGYIELHTSEIQYLVHALQYMKN